jgi:hypothetical protein
MSSHDEIDRRSLLLHRIISARLRGDPELLERVNETVSRWSRSRPHSTALKEWRDLLSMRDIGWILSFLRSRSEEATRLRQSSPFAGILTEEERSRIFRRYASACGRAPL